jgi:hypothetical protein
MKKIILLMGILCSASMLHAQTIKTGIQAGVNFSKLSGSADGESTTTGTLTGFHVGGVLDIDLGAVSIQPGLFYSSKGGKESYNETETFNGVTVSAIGYAKVKLDYLELPVNILYNIPVNSGKVFLGGGPYAGYGISGKTKYDLTASGGGSSASESGEDDIKFGSDGDFKSTDFGINFTAGFRMNSGFAISAGYGLGLTNIANVSDGSVKNHVLKVSAGFFF